MFDVLFSFKISCKKLFCLILKCKLTLFNLEHYNARHDVLGLFLIRLYILAAVHDRTQHGHYCFLQRRLIAPRQVVHDGLVNAFAGLARVQSLALGAQLPALDQREAHASFVVVDLALVALRILR